MGHAAASFMLSHPSHKNKDVARMGHPQSPRTGVGGGLGPVRGWSRVVRNYAAALAARASMTVMLGRSSAGRLWRSRKYAGEL